MSAAGAVRGVSRRPQLWRRRQASLTAQRRPDPPAPVPPYPSQVSSESFTAGCALARPVHPSAASTAHTVSQAELNRRRNVNAVSPRQRALPDASRQYPRLQRFPPAPTGLKPCPSHRIPRLLRSPLRRRPQCAAPVSRRQPLPRTTSQCPLCTASLPCPPAAPQHRAWRRSPAVGAAGLCTRGQLF